MPIRYERDDFHRRVVATIEGPFQVDDMLEIMARQRAEQTWTYGILYDLRGITGHPTSADLRLLSESSGRYLGQAPRGPVALLAADPTLYGRLSTYAAHVQSAAMTIGVFLERAEAERWLTAQEEATSNERLLP
jgi:ribosomal protein S28E/S33